MRVIASLAVIAAGVTLVILAYTGKTGNLPEAWEVLRGQR